MNPVNQTPGTPAPPVNYQPYTAPYTNRPPAGFTPQPPAPKKPARDFSLSESLFAWLSLVFGYLFCRVYPISSSPFGGLIFVVALYTVTLIVLKIKGKSISALSVAVALSAIIISLTLLLCSNSFLHFLAYSYALVAYCYFVYAASGNTVKKGFNDFIVADFFKALFIMPFASFGCMFRAMFTGKSKVSGKVFLKILIGIGTAIIPTLIVFGLLSYDADFTRLLRNILDFDFSDFVSHIGSLILGVPVGLYIYGLFISSVDGKCESALCENGCRKVVSEMRIAPPVTVIAAVVPLMFLYVVFFISQWKYYVSAFTNILPENFSYADYARNGFFELCIVSVINLFIIVTVILLLKRSGKAALITLRITAVSFSLATVILISTAIAKMLMYINEYGLTQKRVYATWLMILIAVVFILICVRLFVRSLKPVAVSFAVGVFMFALLALPNTDAFIAKYNVGRYLNSTLETVDVKAMEELGNSAVPSLVELYKSIDKDSSVTSYRLYYEVAEELRNKAEIIQSSEKDIFSFTIPDALAENALKEIDMI